MSGNLRCGPFHLMLSVVDGRGVPYLGGLLWCARAGCAVHAASVMQSAGQNPWSHLACSMRPGWEDFMWCVRGRQGTGGRAESGNLGTCSVCLDDFADGAVSTAEHAAMLWPTAQCMRGLLAALLSAVVYAALLLAPASTSQLLLLLQSARAVSWAVC